VIAALPAVWRVGVDLLSRLGLDPRRVLRRWAVPALTGIFLVVMAAVLAGDFARRSGSPYYGGVFRIGLIYSLAIAATIPAFLTMWECYRQLAVNDTDGDNVADVNRLLLLRECLLSALTTLGLLVSAGVLTVGAERQASLA